MKELRFRGQWSGTEGTQPIEVLNTSFIFVPLKTFKIHSSPIFLKQSNRASPVASTCPLCPEASVLAAAGPGGLRGCWAPVQRSAWTILGRHGIPGVSCWEKIASTYGHENCRFRSFWVSSFFGHSICMYIRYIDRYTHTLDAILTYAACVWKWCVQVPPKWGIQVPSFHTKPYLNWEIERKFDQPAEIGMVEWGLRLRLISHWSPCVASMEWAKSNMLRIFGTKNGCIKIYIYMIVHVCILYI